MSSNRPDYAALEPPADADPTELSTHERRAAILQRVIDVGTPAAVNQRALATEFDVHESTISRDMDRLREYVDDALGRDATLTTRAVFERTVRELQAEGEWKAAWDVVMDWSEWLEDRGALEREPRRSTVDVDLHSRRAEVAYHVVREGDDEPLPTTDEDDRVDYEALGFAAGPGSVDVEPAEGTDDAE